MNDWMPIQCLPSRFLAQCKPLHNNADVGRNYQECVVSPTPDGVAHARAAQRCCDCWRSWGVLFCLRPVLELACCNWSATPKCGLRHGHTGCLTASTSRTSSIARLEAATGATAQRRGRHAAGGDGIAAARPQPTRHLSGDAVVVLRCDYGCHLAMVTRICSQ